MVPLLRLPSVFTLAPLRTAATRRYIGDEIACGDCRLGFILSSG